jgi:hypothetical protein
LQIADWVAAASLAVSLVALVVATYAIFKSNRNSSVSTLVTLNEAFRQAWERFFFATDEKQRYRQFCELMNLLEIGCGIQVESSLSGVSKKIMRTYLNDVLALLIDNEYTKTHVPAMVHAPDTFNNMKTFIKSKPKYLSVTIPPEWYQLRD